MAKSRGHARLTCAVLGAVLSQSAAADMWSGCVQITSVSAWAGMGFMISVPNLPQQCAATGTKTLAVRPGYGPTGYAPDADAVKALRVNALLAKLTGQSVMLYFADQDLASCYVGIISLGGYIGQCN